MKGDLLNTFRRKVMAAAACSAAVTCVIEWMIIFHLHVITDYLKSKGYRNHILGRDGLDPKAQGLILILAGAIIFCTCFLLLMENVIRYVREIASGIQKISDGDLDNAIRVEGKDEFACIAENLNKMTLEVQTLMDKEREAERTKNDLITNVAHDLRTPLTSIIGYLELLKNKRELDEATKIKFLEIAYQKSKRLEKLIEDLFGFTKLNYGKITMKPQQLDIVKLLEQILDEFYPNFTQADLECEFYKEISSFMIEADGNLLARLFDNLINNAIKYGKDGKVVQVKIFRQNEMICVEVINYGRIIAKHELEHIFEKFYRVEQSRSLDTGGTGLGLAIAKSVVDLHGGIIEAQSSMSGTIFRVKLHPVLQEQTVLYE